ncbi:hypothetical protein Hanom_Chr12g01156291 [Helianthus anomalus]
MDAEVNAEQSPEKEVDNHVGVDNFQDAGSEDENVDDSSDCETDGDDINCIDDSQSMPLNVNKDISEDANDDFIPGIDFSFEAEEVNGEISNLVSHVNKRKKYKKADMGRPSTGYTSSQESLKLLKKAKNDENVFGLDKLLGLNTSQLDKIGDGPRFNTLERDNNLPDLNDQPVGSDTLVEDTIDGEISVFSTTRSQQNSYSRRKAGG